MWSQFGGLTDADLDAEYGCVDFDDCPETTTVKYLSYMDDEGF